MGEQVDLHIHSNKSSDGSFSPLEILHLAKENSFRAISISDHDTVEAYPEAIRLGEEAGVEVIPSIELTTLFGEREFHLLIPFIDWKKKIVKEIVTQVSERRQQEAKGRIEKLQELGFDVTWKEVIEESGSHPPLGVTIAQTLLKKAEKSDQSKLKKFFKGANRLLAPYLFYRDYFADGKPASVPKRNLQLLDILEIVPETGGVPVLAHPGAYFQRVKKEDVAQLKEKGLEGLEVYTSYHNASQTKHYLKLAKEFDLIPTVGSDFHGEIKPMITFGSIQNGGYWMVDKLRKRRP